MHIAQGESAWPDNYPGLLLAQTTKAAMAVDKAHSIYILLEAFSLSLAFRLRCLWLFKYLSPFGNYR